MALASAKMPQSQRKGIFQNVHFLDLRLFAVFCALLRVFAPRLRVLISGGKAAKMPRTPTRRAKRSVQSRTQPRNLFELAPRHAYPKNTPPRSCCTPLGAQGRPEPPMKWGGSNNKTVRLLLIRGHEVRHHILPLRRDPDMHEATPSNPNLKCLLVQA